MKQAAHRPIKSRNRRILVPTIALWLCWRSGLVTRRAVREVTGRATTTAGLGRRSYAGDSSQRLRNKCIDWLRSSKASFVDNPKASVLLPWKVTKKVVFGIDIVAKRASTEEGVDIATIGELTKDLAQESLARIV
jgi:hypothetical protein